MDRICFPTQHLLATASLVAATLASQAFGQASFQGLGDLPGGAIMSEAFGISPDGTVIVGRSTTADGVFGFRWSSATGMIILESFRDGEPVHSIAGDAAAYGLIVCGNSNGGSQPESGACRWIQGVGIVPLVDEPPNPSYGAAITPNGSVVVGQTNIGSNQFRAYRWSAENNDVTLLQGLNGFSDAALAVSDDGTIIVGSSQNGSGTRAFRWTAATGMVEVADLPDGPLYAQLYALSADGTVAVGLGTSLAGQEATRWTQAGGTVSLGDLPGGAVSAHAWDVSADGAIIVGHGTTALGEEAFIWDAAHGMRRLKDVLQDDFGLDLAGWTLLQAQAVSSDGTIIAGFGINPAGHTEAWRAVVPPRCPSDLDHDGIVGPADLGILLGDWGACG